MKIVAIAFHDGATEEHFRGFVNDAIDAFRDDGLAFPTNRVEDCVAEVVASWRAGCRYFYLREDGVVVAALTMDGLNDTVR